ncbi:hypothetical protein GCM10010872_20900 [Dyella flava]|nr:hypothetical protein GCM10010872_20900 [Dyella flava]
MGRKAADTVTACRKSVLTLRFQEKCSDPEVSGIIKSPMHAPETHGALAGLHPVGRMGEMSDIVEAVLFLESAGFVTGEILHVDGGQSAGH